MSEELVRYGVRNGANEAPVCAPMADGYWTPWHVANDALLAAARERDEWATKFSLLRGNYDAASRERNELLAWQREAAFILRFAANGRARAISRADALALLARVKP